MASDEPPEKDMKEFEFVQLCKFRVSESDLASSTDRSQMLTCSSTYGLVIYATKTGFNVVKTSDLLSTDEAIGSQRNKVTVKDFPVLAKVSLPSSPIFLVLSGDGACLVVIFKDTSGEISIVFFDIHGFADKNTSPQPFAKLPLNPGTSVVDIAWNPTVVSMLAICYSDGSMALVDVSDKAQVVTSAPSMVGATCFSWSPKGKQLLVGKKDGTLSQYDHVLAEKKKWDCPSVFNSGQSVVDVVWLSTYMFIAAYLPIGAQDSVQPLVVMTMSNKEGNTSYINFDDVCFSNGEDRKPQYLFHNLQKWEVVLMASNRATEATLVGKNLDNKTSWERWNLEDCSRAELPLTEDQNDSFPLGMAVDYSPSKPVVLSEIKTFPACPVMFLLSTDGLLLAYYLHYFHTDAAAQVTSPAQPLNPAKAKKGVTGLLGKSMVTPSPASQPPASISQISMKPPAATGATTATAMPTSSTDSSKPPLNMFTASSVNKPAAPAFQFGKSTDSPVASSTPNQKPPLLATPSSAAQAQTQAQAQAGQGQPVSSSFAFTFGGPTNKFGQSSAFATIPPSSSSTATTGLKFGQPSLVPAFGSSTPADKTGTPFMAPSFTAQRQTTPPGSHQAMPPSQQPASSTSTAAPGIFAPQKTQAKPIDLKTQQQPPPAVSKPQQQLQQDSASTFSNTSPKPPPPMTRPFMGGFGGQGSPGGGAEIRTPRGNMTQSQLKNITQPETVPVSVDANASIEATLDSAFSQNIVEEIAHFEDEIKKLRLRSKRDVKVVGTKTEMQSLRRNTEGAVNFLSDIKDVVKDQLFEVQDLKSNYINLFADAEKSRTQLQRNADPHYHSLLQGRALDPASAEQLKNIQQMSQLLEQTLSEVNHTLDSQWEQHLAQKSRQSRLTTPTGETIYKTIKNNHQIISYQRRNLEKLEEKMCNLRLSSKEMKRDPQPVFNFVAEESPSSSGKQEFTPGLKKPLTLKKAVSQGMTPEKVSRLKEFLSQRRVPLVKSKTPANLSMSRIVYTTPRRPASQPTSNPHNLLQQLQYPQGQTPQQQQYPQGQTPQQQQYPQGQTPQQQQYPQGQTPQQQQYPQGQTPQQQQYPQGQTPQQQQYQQGPTSKQQHLQSPQQQPSVFGNAMAYQNNPAGIPSAELRLQKGPVLNPDMPKPVMQDFRFSPQQPPPASIFGGGVKSGSPSGIQPGSLNIQRPQQQVPPLPQMGGPTSFSGVAYFKQPPAPMPPSGMRPGGMLPQQYQQQQHFPADLQAATQMLSKHLGAGGMLNLPAMLSAETDNGGKNAMKNAQQFTQVVYEDITPTETDETNEDDDDEDYEEEDNGYEDEDEEEYDDEEGYGQDAAYGFVSGGQNTSFFPVKTLTSTKEGSSPQQNLNAPSSTPGSLSQGQNPPLPGFTNLSGMAPKNVFGGKPSTLPSSVPGGTTATTSSGFSFGNTSAVFGQKIPAVTSTTAGSGAPLFGGTTLSRSVGFSDLAKGSDGTQTSGPPPPPSVPSIFGGNSGSSPGSKFGFSTTPSPPAASTTKPASPPSSDFSFVTAAASSSPSSAGGGSIFGAPKSITSPPIPAKTEQKPAADFKPKASSPDSSSTTISQQPVAVTTASTSPTASSSASTSVFGNTSGFQFGSSSTPQKSSPVSSSTNNTGNVAASTALAPSSPQATPPSASPNQVSSTQVPVASTTTAADTSGSLGTSASIAATAASATLPSSGNSVTISSAPVYSGNSLSVSSTPAAAATTTTPLFGVNSSAAASSLFVGVKTTSSSSIFGTASPATTSSVFGGSATASTTASIFSSDATKSSAPLFGGSSTTATTSAAPLFGANKPASTVSSLFGATNSTATTAPSIFGVTSSTSSAPSLFGSSTSSAPLFGTPTTAPPPFGSSTTSPFFGGATATTTTASIFGSGDSGGSSFSFSTQPGGSTFGSGFGGGQTSQTSSTDFSFNNQPATNSQDASSGGGAASLFGGFGGLGAKPSEEKANTNVFGSPQTFGNATTTQSNLFGNNNSSPFGGTFGGPGNAFAGGDGGSFSSVGKGGVGATGFGVTNNTSSSHGVFGSTPSFGSAPSFGGGGTSAFGSGSSKPGFGSPSAFGSTATFGAGNTFGSTAGPSNLFGSSAGNTASSGFGSFASSTTPTFGQLAQGSPVSFGGAGGNPGGGFGSGAPASPFGAASAGGTGAFGGAPVFGQSPSAGGGGFGSPPAGFGNQGSTFGSSPAFSSYRG